MSRAWIAWLFAGLLTLAGGCKMCASPYDECGPLFSGQNPSQCNPGVRAGSVLSASATPAALPAANGEVLSVTDANAFEAAPALAKPAGESSAQPAVVPTDPQSSVSRGWKPVQAKRSSPNSTQR
jgi:hypothetical protein